MVKIIPSDRRFTFNTSWLKARWHFSFGHYHDPENMGFGPLRVFNDDVIAPGGGFGMHPHEEMEIVTYVLSGELAHKDSTGGSGRLGPGDVQHMTAGSGIRHSEFNPSSTTSAHLMQIWIEPDASGLTPEYQQKHFDPTPGKLTLIAAPDGREGALKIRQDVTMATGTLLAGQTMTHLLTKGRRAYVFVIDGKLKVNGESVAAGGQARVEGEEAIALEPDEETQVMLIDLP